MRKVLIATAALLMGGVSATAAAYDADAYNHLCRNSFEALQEELQGRTWVSAQALLGRLDQIHFLCAPYQKGQKLRDIMHEQEVPLGPEPSQR